jgi:hypothetical protein
VDHVSGSVLELGCRSEKYSWSPETVGGEPPSRNAGRGKYRAKPLSHAGDGESMLVVALPR